MFATNSIIKTKQVCARVSVGGEKDRYREKRHGKILMIGESG